MINPKNICICSCIGFCLSFLIGLFSDVRFANVLFRAFLFALLFAALCIGISFIYQKFLSTDAGGFSAEGEQPPQRPAAGSVINIVVDDSNLSDEEHAPQFTVANAKPSMGFGSDLSNEDAESSSKKAVLDNIEEAPPQAREAPVAASPRVEEVRSAEPVESRPVESHATSVAQASEEPAPAASFKPADLGNLTASQTAAPAPSSSEEGGALDALPDIGDVNLGGDSDSDSSDAGMDAEIVTDSEFASNGASFKDTTMVSQDTTVMAKAIQTLLAKDN